MTDAPKPIILDVGLLRDCADEALSATLPLETVRERLLDLADPRVTPQVPDRLRAQLRELAGEIADVDQAVARALDVLDRTIADALGNEDGA